MVMLRDSTKLDQELQKYCHNFQIVYKKPKLENDPRWNSVIKMIRAALEMWKPMKLLFSIENIDVTPLNDNVRRILEDIVILLERMEKATLVLQSETQPTIVEGYLLINGLIEFLSNSAKSNDHLSNMATTMKDKFIEVQKIYDF
jgi:hypothetical protein